jgi:hypothetical protein
MQLIGEYRRARAGKGCDRTWLAGPEAGEKTTDAERSWSARGHSRPALGSLSVFGPNCQSCLLPRLWGIFQVRFLRDRVVFGG